MLGARLWWNPPQGTDIPKGIDTFADEMRRLIVILLLLFPCTLWAQEPRFVHYNAADGLPSNTIYAITQDADGILWIGTRNGLASFDGVRFQSRKEYGRVNALAVDRGGRLWIGTTEGLRVKDSSPAAQDDKRGAQNDRKGVQIDRRANNRRVDDSAEGKVQAGHDGKVAGNIRALLADSEGFVWATVGDTLLLKLSYKDGIREEARCWYDKRDSEGDYPYYQIFEASDGKLYSFDDYTSILYTYERGEVVPHGSLSIVHARLLTDSKGRLWAAGSYGVGIVDTAHPENTSVFRRHADDPTSPSSSELYCIFEDRQGDIWVGGDNCLSVICPAYQQVKTLSSANVTALMQDRSGKIWTGTAEERVSCLYEDSAGTVYVGLWNNTGWEVWKDGKMFKDRLSGPLPEEQKEARVNLPPHWLSPFRYPSAQVDSNIYLSSGASGYLAKDSAPESIAKAIADAAGGKSLFFGETIDADRITRIFGGEENLQARKPQGLTPRELEVLQLTTSGYSNAQIASALEISLNTVDSYKERIKGKFGLDSMVECVACAVKRGIVSA